MPAFWALGLKGLAVLEHVKAAFSPHVFGAPSSERFSTSRALERRVGEATGWRRGTD